METRLEKQLQWDFNLLFFFKELVKLKQGLKEKEGKIHLGGNSLALTGAAWGLMLFAHMGYEMNGFISVVLPCQPPPHPSL